MISHLRLALTRTIKHNTRSAQPTKFLRTMSTSNSSGVKIFAEGGETDHGLPLSPEKLQVVMDVQALFCSKPTEEIFSRTWEKTAIFEDPICIAIGEGQWKSQWYGMPKAFPKSITLAWKVVRDDAGILEYEQRQEYTVAGINKVKVMSSLVHIELNSENKITRLEDRWDGNPMPSGSIAKHFRGLNGRFMPYLVGTPKV